MPRLQYTRSERTRRKHATALLANQNASPAAQTEALKTLRQTEENARRRIARTGKNTPETATEQPDQSYPWMTGYTPTAAQQAVINQLLEDGNEHEAEIWFLVYQMEAAGKVPAEVPNV